MSSLRSAALDTLRQAEKQIDGIPETLTLETIEDIKSAMRAIVAAQRNAVTWLDAVEV